MQWLQFNNKIVLKNNLTRTNRAQFALPVLLLRPFCLKSLQGSSEYIKGGKCNYPLCKTVLMLSLSGSSSLPLSVHWNMDRCSFHVLLLLLLQALQTSAEGSGTVLKSVHSTLYCLHTVLHLLLLRTQMIVSNRLVKLARKGSQSSE